MRRHRKSALEAATGLATVLGLLHAGQARASDDPFALPPATSLVQIPQTATAINAVAKPDSDYVLYADVTINGDDLPRVVKLREINGELFIASESAIYAGLAGTGTPPDFISLRQIPGITFEFDQVRYHLEIRRLRKSDGPNRIDLRPAAAQTARGSTSPLTALVVDYDATMSRSSEGISAAGLVNVRLVRDNVALQSGWRFLGGANLKNPAAVRLDTALTIRAPELLLRATAGDFVTITPGSARAIRMGGIQIASDFGLRPDLVTYPLPDFAGNVALPSALDLVINDRRLSQTAVEPGEFTVRNIPVPLGRNEVGVVVRDALGREQVQSVSLYSSRDLLVPGLFKGALSIGAVRRRYGVASANYGAIAVAAMAERGINRHFTGEFALELHHGFINTGPGARLTLGSLGLVGIATRLSSFHRADGTLRRGALIGFNFESIGPTASLRFEAQRVTDGYDDLASSQGDEPPRSLIAANIGFDLKQLGTVSFAVIQQTRQRGLFVDEDARKNRILTASYRSRLAPGIDVFLNVSDRSGGGQRHAVSALFGLSVQFGCRVNAQSSLSLQDASHQVELGVYRPDSVPGEFGYSLQAGTGTIDRLSGSIAYRGSGGRIEAQGEAVAGQIAVRFGARGSLVLADGNLFAVQDSSNAFVLADSRGVPGIHVLREQRPAGVTGRTGKRLIADITPNVPLRIGIDPAALPLGVDAAKLEDIVQVPQGAVVKLDLGVSRYVPARFRLTGLDGSVFAPGTLVRTLPSRSEYLVGFDGLIELNGAVSDRELQAELGNGEFCYAEIKLMPFVPGEGPFELRCFGRSRTVALSEILGDASHSRAREKALPNR